MVPTFTVRLPVAGAIPVTEAPRTVDPLPRGSEWILVVDDEDGVRDFMDRALSRLGYHVTAVSSGEEALERVRDYFAEPIDLLITDVVLPGISGPELASTLGSARPQMPVLYVSGYASDVTAFHGLPGLAAHVLAKPFGMDGLVRRVRTILDERPGPRARSRNRARRRANGGASGVAGGAADRRLTRGNLAVAPPDPPRCAWPSVPRGGGSDGTLITNGTIVTADGSYVADVLINGDTITQIGRDPAGSGTTADRVRLS